VQQQHLEFILHAQIQSCRFFLFIFADQLCHGQRKMIIRRLFLESFRFLVPQLLSNEGLVTTCLAEKTVSSSETSFQRQVHTLMNMLEHWRMRSISQRILFLSLQMMIDHISQ
jgi:hypothetical protein